MTVSETTPAAATTTQLREELLLRRLAGDAAAHHPQITPVDRSSPLPLSFGQQQLWFLSRLAPDSPEYLVPLTLRLRGPLDVAALRRSWEHVVTRHEILRTRYVLRGNEPAQVVDPPGPADFPVVDVSGEVLERHLAYWRTRLAGMEPTELPTDRPRPSVRSWQGAAVPFDIPDDVAEGVRELGRRHGATPFMVLLAALQTLLARYTGKSDIAVGTVVSERGAPELQKLIGYGINSLVMRSEVTGDMSFAELLAGVRTTVLDAFDHADVPFARLVDELQPERDTSRTPLFQVAFTMHEPLSLIHI